jgi:hypothetical protein
VAALDQGREAGAALRQTGGGSRRWRPARHCGGQGVEPTAGEGRHCTAQAGSQGGRRRRRIPVRARRRGWPSTGDPLARRKLPAQRAAAVEHSSTEHQQAARASAEHCGRSSTTPESGIERETKELIGLEVKPLPVCYHCWFHFA